MTIKAIILVGGPSRGTRFRPLSLDVPKPLFPVAGQPIIWHHLAALAKIDGLKEVLLIGFFEDSVFSRFIDDASTQFPHVNVRYLREYQALGTAGGIYHFRDEILRNKPDQFYVLHAGVACSFPLDELYHAHMKHRGLCTILGTKVQKEQSLKFGCLIAKPETNEVLHYVEKPESFLSQLISCGVYLFDVGIFGEIQKAMERKKEQASDEDPDAPGRDEKLRLEQDLITPLAASHKLYVYETRGFWRQIKTAGSAVPANSAFLEQFSKHQPERLAKKGVPGGPEIIGAVYIHPSAQVDPTAKIGPNVSIGPRVQIGKGVRIKDSIILDVARIGLGSVIIHAVIGWDAKIGSWARVEGSPTIGHTTTITGKNGVKSQSITILGRNVSVKDETIIRNCIVLPHKELRASFHNEILM